MIAKLMRSVSGVVAGAVVAALLMWTPSAGAANKYWDTTSAGGLLFGDGAWDTGSTALWSTAAGGTALATWATGDDAFFQAVGTSIVTVNTASVRNITFDNGNAITRIVAGSGPLTLTGNITANWNNGGTAVTNIISSDIILGNNSAITFQRNYGDGANGNFLVLDGAISGAYKLTINRTSATGGGGNGTLWLNNGANSFSGGFDAGGRYVYTTATSGTPFGTGNIDTRAGYGSTPVVPIYLSPSGSGADVALSAANAAAGTKININGGGLFVLNKGANNTLTFTVGNAAAAANSVINRVGARDALTVQYTNTLGTDEKFIVNGGVSVGNGMVTPYITGLKGTATDFLTYDAAAGFKVTTYDLTNDFTGSGNTSKILVTGNLAPGANVAAYALNLRSGTLDLGGNTLAMGNGSDPAGLLIGGTLSNGKVTSAGDLVVTSNGGTINASVEGTGTLAASGAGTLKLGGDVKIANISAGAATIELSGNAAQSVSSVINITAGVLSKTGTGTASMSSAGNAIKTLTVTGGQFRLDNSVSGSPTLTVTDQINLNNKVASIAISNATMTASGGVKVMQGRFVVEGSGTLTTTGGDFNMGEGDGISSSVYVKNTATINGTGRALNIGNGWANRSHYFRMQDSAQATFSTAGVLALANYCDGHGHGSTFEIQDSAKLTTTGNMDVMRQANDQNRTGTIYAHAQVYQHGGTVKVGGDLRMGLEDVAVGTGNAVHKVRAVYNLWDGTLEVAGKITGGATRTGYGQSFLNLHGGTIKYTGAGAQNDFINLTATAGTAGTTSVNNLRLWEDSTIDTGSQTVTINQAILAPTGNGISAISTAGLNTQVYGNDIVPWVYVDGGGGSGASAVATLGADGKITGFVITNPGTDYTSAPTIHVVRAGEADQTVASGNITLASNASYSGGLIKSGAGTLILNGSNTYEGRTTINAGTVRMGHANALSSFENELVINGNGSTLDMQGHSKNVSYLEGTGDSIITGTGDIGSNILSVNQTSDTAFAGALQNNVSLAKSGSGTLTLSGTHTTEGSFEVSGGTLAITGTKSGLGDVTVSSGGILGGGGIISGATTIAAGGVLAPGNSPGSLEFTGDLTLDADSSSVFQLAGTAFALNATEEYDRVKVTGLTTLAGTLSVSLIDGFTLGANQMFGIVDATGGRTGTFSGLSEGAIVMSAGGYDLRITYQGDVGDEDLALTGGQDVVLYTIPEPATVGVILLGLVGMGLRRRAMRA